MKNMDVLLSFICGRVDSLLRLNLFSLHIVFLPFDKGMKSFTAEHPTVFSFLLHPRGGGMHVPDILFVSSN